MGRMNHPSPPAAGRSPVRAFARGWPWWIAASLLLVALGAWAGQEQEMRFPKPDFKSGYDFPPTAVPGPRSELLQWVDVGVFAVALALGSWLAVKRHSRRGLFWLMVFSLLYFGFYKEGCICPIGSIQNVALAIFNPHYALPAAVLVFFLLPLAVALLFGRVFCASVCALGAIQDLVLVKPIQVPRNLSIALGVIPYAYLGLAVLLAATNTGFLICRFDPFIGFFRMTGNAPYLFFGAAFLLPAMFVGRPYCRFLCPYGVLLGWMSRFSGRHLTITPSDCINCRLCETSCPFDYIHKPNAGLARENRQSGVRRLGFLLAMLPVLALLCGWVGHRLSVPLSRYNNTVALAEKLVAERRNPALEPTVETRTFRTKGTPEGELIASALSIRHTMDVGGWIVGGLLGVVIGAKLIGFSTFRTRKDYEVDKARCFSCARCCTYCPNDQASKVGLPAAPPAPSFPAPAPAPATPQESRS